MTWTQILDILADLGAATASPLWLPVAAWTLLALPVWLLLKQTDRLHPLAEYRLSQVLLAALPISIAAAGIVELLPESPTPPLLPDASVLVLPAVESTAAPAPEFSWQWNHAIGALTVLAIAIGGVELGRFGVNAVALGRVRSLLAPTTAPSLQKELNRLKDRLNVRRPVRVCANANTAVPVTLGGRQPVILVPQRLTRATEALRMTLRHELVHVRRWDDVAQFVERVVAAVFAVHPLVGRLRRRIEEARERACDAAVLDDGQTPTGEYAHLLATFADGSGPRRLGALSLSESPSSLTDRLSAMRSSMPSLLSSRVALGTALVAVGLTLTLGVVACSDSIDPTPPSDADESAAADRSPPTSSDSVYVVVEDQPELKGGMSALQESISYPETAKEAGIQGRVIVQFIVDRDGNVTNPTVTRGVHEVLDQAALDAVKAQEFEPGRQDGEAMKVQMSLPVTFRLPGQDDSKAPQSDNSSKPEAPVKADYDEVYMVVDDQPELVGGMEALQEAVTYPERAREAGIEGGVIVQFVVDENGNVTNPKITRGVHEALDRAAIEAVKTQTFKPGRQDGKPVPVRMSLPVTFDLSNESSSSSGLEDAAGEPSAVLESDSRQVYDLEASSTLAEGSVEVTANGKTLRKGIDYTVDHDAGTVTLTRASSPSTGVDIEISYEEKHVSS